MTKRSLKLKRILSFVLAIVMVLSLFQTMGTTATAANGIEDGVVDYVADESTMDDWIEFFGADTTQTISTENSGAVWTDKSVFTDKDGFSNVPSNIPESTLDFTSNGKNFLVALSTMSSYTQVTGKTNKPTDTMIVLDLSSSMYRSQTNNQDTFFYPTTIEPMLEAVNDTIDQLQQLNEHNRVGVTVYFGGGTRNIQSGADSGFVMLPLNRYRSHADGYLTATLQNGELKSVQSNPNLRTEDGKAVTVARRTLTEVAGTYMQLGILHALDQFMRSDIDTKVPDTAAFQAGEERTPVMVIMSDGEPTAATANYTTKEQAGMGNNTVKFRNAAETDFLTQLTASYAKEKIDSKYVSTTPIFYTLSLGTSISWDVMDPANTLKNMTEGNAVSTKIEGYWNSLVNNHSLIITAQNLLNAWENDNTKDVSYTVRRVGLDSANTTMFPTSISQQLYVDKAFEAQDAGDLADAFASIYGDISIQTHYYPTLVQDNEEVDGYVSFVDKIGEYMNVTDIKGIIIDNTLYTGAGLAENFVPGGAGLGTNANPTDLGNELVWSVQQRLGIPDVTEARAVLGLAYQHKQLSYTSPTEFSNYIGWYANANGEYLGFWYDGIETMPDPNDPNLTDATRPRYIIKSYGYIGATDEAHGISSSDLMYATIQVREDLLTGEQTLAFAVPAALIPLISYDVKLDENGRLESLTEGGAESPIRLLYEVELDEGINERTVSELVDADYIAANTDANGNIEFYSNQYESDNTTGYNTVNTYSYFRPSRQNEEYYHLADAPVYIDTAGTLYRGETGPNVDGVYYRAYTIYEKNGTALNTRTVYRQLAKSTLETARKAESDNTWYIPSGNVHVNMDGNTVYKNGANASSTSGGPTGTLSYANQPYVDINSHSVNDLGHRFVVGATLGNNGLVKIRSTTGMKISKTVAETNADTAAPVDFEFTITRTDAGAAADNRAYSAVRVEADGTEVPTTVAFEDGKGTVSLKDGESIYITEMTAGATYKITETETQWYKVISVNGDDTVTDATITLVENDMADAAFVNTAKGTGSLTITKIVEHELGEAHEIPEDLKFTMEVTLSGTNVEVANKTFEAVTTDKSITSVTTDASGKFTAELGHGEQITVSGLPDGTTATVVETGLDQMGDGWSVRYQVSVDGVINPDYVDTESGAKASVDIQEEEIEFVDVDNMHDPEYPEFLADPTLNIGGTKYVKDTNGVDQWALLPDDASFSFVLEQYNGSAWTRVDTQTVTKESESKEFSFNLKNLKFTDPGTYSFQVYEEVGTVEHIFYEPLWYTFIVVVTDEDMNSELEISDVHMISNGGNVTKDDNGIWSVTTDINNTYYEIVPVLVTADIQKNIDNESGNYEISKEDYEFELYSDRQCSTVATTDAEVISIDREATDGVGEGWIDIQIDGSGMYKKDDQGNFVKVDGKYEIAEGITTNDAGEGTRTYTYYIKEKGTSTDTMTYDSTIVKMVITVYANIDGTLRAETSYYKVDGETDIPIDYSSKELNFTNTYKAEPTAALNLNVEKVLTGRELVEGEFTFVLKDNGDSGVSYTGTNDADGKVTFDRDVTFDKVGVYYYTLSETAGISENTQIEYDSMVYDLRIDVTDENGQLVADYMVLDIVGEDMTFNNLYDPDMITHGIRGTKELKGRGLVNDEFTFVLAESDAYGTIHSGAKTWEAKNYTDGHFEFRNVTFTEEGTYHYVVYEKPDDVIGGIEFDSTRYLVTVTVTSTGDGGSLEASHTIAIGDVPAEEIKFVNIYEPNPTTVPLPGVKTLNGKVLTEGVFSFDLFEADSSWKITNNTPVKTVYNDEDGLFQLTTPELTKEGTYYYVVKETYAGQTLEGITYDDTVYGVEIVVTDDRLGKLHTEVKTYNLNKNGELSDIEFVNTYTITDDGSLILEGTKVLTGRELKDGEFTFELYDKTNKKTMTAVNKDGKFQFELEFKASDVGSEFEYVLTEKAGNLEDITYDDSEYVIKVTVVDNGKGGVTTNTVIKKDGIGTKTITFENAYTGDPGDPNNPGDPSGGKDRTALDTGDHAATGLWLAIAGVALAAIVIVLIFLKRRK